MGRTMQRCRMCGTEIDDTQALEFDGRCPACVRLGLGVRTNEPPQNIESSIWLIVMVVGGLMAVSSLLTPFIVMSWFGSIPGWSIDLSSFFFTTSLPYVVFGIIGVWFGHRMYKKASRKTGV